MEQVLTSKKLLAFVVTKAKSPTYREMLSTSAKSVPVIGCDCPSQEDPLLAELDRLLEADVS